jgi:hypothetical protein
MAQSGMPLDPQGPQVLPQDLQAAQQMDYNALSQFFMQKYGIKLPQVRPSIDDHGIHSREHRAKAKTESALAWPQIVQILLEKHNEAHQQLLQAQQQAVMQQQQGGVPGGFMHAGPSPMRGASGAEALKGQMREMSDAVTQGGAHFTK